MIFYVCIHSVRGLWGMQSQLCQTKKSDIFFFCMKELQNVWSKMLLHHNISVHTCLNHLWCCCLVHLHTCTILYYDAEKQWIRMMCKPFRFFHVCDVQQDGWRGRWGVGGGGGGGDVKTRTGRYHIWPGRGVISLWTKNNNIPAEYSAELF